MCKPHSLSLYDSFFLSYPRHSKKAFLTVFQSSQGSEENHWLNTGHFVCRADHGCSWEKGLFRPGTDGKLLPWGRGRVDFMAGIWASTDRQGFFQRDWGGRWREETEVGAQRSPLLHILQDKRAQHSRLNHSSPHMNYSCFPSYLLFKKYAKKNLQKFWKIFPSKTFCENPSIVGIFLYIRDRLEHT